MRDLEWLWMAWMAILLHVFTTTNCHCLIICYLFTVVCLLHLMWPAEKCGKRSIANSDPQRGRILESAENLRIFRGRYRRNFNKWRQHYYIVLFSPCRLSTDPKIRDLMWLWMAWMAILRYIFTTTNCHWLIICCLFSVVCLSHVVRRAEKCGKRNIANSNPQSGSIFGIRGKSFCLKFCFVPVCLELWSLAFEAWLLLNL